MSNIGILLERPKSVMALEEGGKLVGFREYGGVLVEAEKLGHTIVAASVSTEVPTGLSPVVANVTEIQADNTIENPSGSLGGYVGEADLGEMMPDALIQSGRHSQIEIPLLNPNSFIQVTASQVTSLEALSGTDILTVPWTAFSSLEIREMVANGSTVTDLAEHLRSTVYDAAKEAGFDQQRYVLKLANTSASSGVVAGSLDQIADAMSEKLFDRFTKKPDALAPRVLLEPFVDSYVPSPEYKFSMIRVFVADNEVAGFCWRVLPADAPGLITIGSQEELLYIDHELNHLAGQAAREVMHAIKSKAGCEHATGAVDFIPAANGIPYFLEINSAPVRPTRFNQNAKARDIGVNLDELNAGQLINMSKGGGR